MVAWQDIDRYVLDVLILRYPERVSIAKVMDILMMPVKLVKPSLDRLTQSGYAVTDEWGFWWVTDKGLKGGISTPLEG